MDIRTYAGAALAVGGIVILGATGWGGPDVVGTRLPVAVLAGPPTPEPLICVTDLDGQKRCYLEDELCDLGLRECDDEIDPG